MSTWPNRASIGRLTAPLMPIKLGDAKAECEPHYTRHSEVLGQV
jgi:hypothetical protein